MTSRVTDEPIQRDVAQRLCHELLAERRQRWWEPSSWRCQACAWLSRGDPTQLAFASRPDNRGCRAVSARWEALGRPLH